MKSSQKMSFTSIVAVLEVNRFQETYNTTNYFEILKFNQVEF